MIDRLASLWPKPLSGTVGGGASAAGGAADRAAQDTGASFQTVFREALRSLEAGERAADQSTAAFALGLPIAPHQVMLSVEAARLNLELAVQIRNKAVEAYQELMRMPL
ncbi:MAG: flagellar hook-basal body complex protein FliE [Hydrogenibacillus sp.]|nr:flagellar hook-basal body complex protein FliE [Hydrogenibacillus sp.]